MTVDVRTEIVIDRPARVVTAFAMDPDNAPRWYENITSVEWQTPRPLRVGSRIAFTAQFLGRRLAYTYEIVELTTGKRLRMRTAEGPFPMETTYEFEKVGAQQCRVRLRNRGTPSGFPRMFTPILGFAMRRANRKDLLSLKTLLENSA